MERCTHPDASFWGHTWRRQTAFTLIELIAVIVILAIVATIGTNFVVKVTQSYQNTQNRVLLINRARPSLERITRQLRGVLPFSVDIVNSGSCVKFLPIVAAGNYLTTVPDANNLVAANNTITVSPHTIIGTAKFVTIGALAPAELYVAGTSRAGYSTTSTAILLVLTAPKQWLRNSLNKRFYLTDNPQAFCVVGGELRFYEGIDITRGDVDVTAPSSLMAQGVTATQPFLLATGSENRNVMVNIALTFSIKGESMLFNQAVMIRNVP